MAQITQIVPRFSFPYVETHVNDNTVVTNTTAATAETDGAKFIWPFVGPMGPDNKFIKITSLPQFEKVFGKTNYKKYGQPMMMPVAALSSGNASVYCMRVMPENATFAYKTVAVAYKVLNGEDSDGYRLATGTDDMSAKVVVVGDTEVADSVAATYTFADGNQYGVSGFSPEYIVQTGSLYEDTDSNTDGALVVVPTGKTVMSVSEFKNAYGDQLPYDDVTLDDVVAGAKFIARQAETMYFKKNATTEECTHFIVEDGWTDRTVEVSASDLLTDDDIGTYVVATESVWGSATVSTPGAVHVVDTSAGSSFALLSKVQLSLPTAVSGDVVVLSGKVDSTPSDTVFDIKLVEYTDTLTDVDRTTVDGLKKVFQTSETVVDDQSSELLGYTVKPIMLVYSNGRGEFGNNYRFRMSRNSSYEAEYGINMNTFDILTTVGGLTKVATYVAGNVSSLKYEVNTCINDVLDDYTDTEVPVKVFVDEDYMDTLRDVYVEFCKSKSSMVDAELKAAQSETTVSFMRIDETHPYAKKVIADGTKLNDELQVSLSTVQQSISDIQLGEFVVTKVDYLKHLKATTTDDMLPDTDEFSPFFGKVVAKDYSLPYVKVSVDDAVNFISIAGCPLTRGTDGFLTEGVKRSEKYDSRTPFDSISDVVYGTSYGFTEDDIAGWGVEQEVELLYNQAFDGTLDPKILSAKRLDVTAWFDANYPMSVKRRMAELVALRGDSLCFLDTGIIPSLSKYYVEKTLIPQFAEFDSFQVSKNLHHYVTKEASTGKRVPVTITHFLAPAYATHVARVGNHIPFVKSYAQLSGHIKDSIYPIIEDFDTELKTLLYNNRFNYFETVTDNVFQRATQNTAQLVTSDLSEESNVSVLLEMKKLIEADITSSLYNFADETERNSFTSYQKARFATWTGSKFQSMNITFASNAWESENSIIHAYLEVVFRGIYKRAIVEIDINKRTYTDTTTTLVSV